MDKLVGITAEYNPFHKGHKQHLALSLEAAACQRAVVVLSGNFVQRGEPALVDKWKRTRMALRAGASLVIELPLYYATAAAGYFAKGAVSLLHNTGIIDSISFGSETADIEALQNYAEILLKKDDSASVRKYLKQGLSYPAAVARSANADMPSTPNDILGVEYIKALKELSSGIKPVAVPRSPGSALEVRNIIKSGEAPGGCLPAYAHDILEGSVFADLDNLSLILRYKLGTEAPDILNSYLDVSEGLENRLIRCAKECTRISELLPLLKTKRYTYLRLQRAILHIILNITKKNMKLYEDSGGPCYIRVLGFRKDSADLLKLLQERSALPVILNLKNLKLDNSNALMMLHEEIRSSNIYALAFKERVNYNEYSMPIIII